MKDHYAAGFLEGDGIARYL